MNKKHPTHKREEAVLLRVKIHVKTNLELVHESQLFTAPTSSLPFCIHRQTNAQQLHFEIKHIENRQ